MTHKTLYLLTIGHLIMAFLFAVMFLHGIDGPIHNSWLHWLMFVCVWPNVWIASKYWNDIWLDV